jgi:excisionase family DNA binding protein
MPQDKQPIEPLLPSNDVLTLEEAAVYLRVTPEGLKSQAANGRMPAQLVDGEWRFLKSALMQWLKFGPRTYEEMRRFAFPFWPDHPMIEEWLHTLEQRIVAQLTPPPSQRGTKETALRHFGIFSNEQDLEDVLATLQEIRK